VKVLHLVATAGRRGAELFAASLIGHLDKADVEQRVVVLRSGSGRVLDFGTPVNILPAGRTIPWLRTDERRIRELVSDIAKWKPDVIQAHGGESLKYAVLAASSTPIVYRRIGGAHPSLRRPVRRRLYGNLMRRADRVVTVAEALREETLALFHVPSERVVTIPNAVDPSRVQPIRNRSTTRQSLGISAKAAVMVSIGALTWEKDPAAHLEVSRRVLQVRRDAIHLIAGDGPMRGEAEDTSKRWAIDDRIRFLGVRADVADLLSAADVLLFASRPDGMEGMPAVLIEAGMCGLPVAGFDVAGAREVVVDGVTGRLVPWFDLDGLARAVVELFDRGSSMGLAARARCYEQFSIDRIAKQYLDLYEEVLTR
jgi:glycosyltransferase involved in cell wall biosynthesis